MKILMNRHFSYCNYGTREYFDSMHKIQNEYTGRWVDVDTSKLYKNCYYIPELNTCISDNSIVRVYDDERLKRDIYECPECGFQGSLEELENHKTESSKLIKQCKCCKFFKMKRVGEMKADHFIEKVNLTDDSYTEIKQDRYVFNYKKRCDYHYDGDVCKFNKCSEAPITNPFKDVYFVKHPYGNIFDKFEFDKDVVEFSVGSYVVKFFLPIKRVTMTNSRRSFDIELPLKKVNSTYVYCDWALIKDGEKSRTLYNLETWVADKASEIYSAALKFNNKVTDDWYYTEPDGTVLQKVIIDGKEIERPRPIDWDILK